MSRVLKFTFFTTAILILVGCARNYSQNSPITTTTAAQDRSTQISNQVKSTGQAVRDCTKKQGDSPSGVIVRQSILVEGEDQPNKFDLLSSKAKLNEAQKKALKQYLAANAVCRKISIEGNAGLPYQTILLKALAEKDVIYTQLLTGKLTVGEANLAIQALNVNYRESRKAESAKLDQTLKNQHASEIQNIQRQQQIAIENQQRQQLIEDKKRQSNLDAYRTFTAPPPPMQIIQPGTVRGNDIRCSPDGSGGYNCR